MFFHKKQIKIGLALGSGGARGLAHIGVLKALEKHNIKIDFIAGTSAGSLIGGLYASLGLPKIIELVNEVNYQNLVSLFADPLMRSGFFKKDRIIDYLNKQIKDIQIENLPIKFAAVATNINTGKTQAISSGDLTLAIRASSSVPVVLQPQKIHNDYFIDGGVSLPVPCRVVREMGADIVIGVNVYPGFKLVRHQGTKEPGVVDQLKTSLDLLLYNLSIENLKDADIAIDINDMDVTTFDFVSGKKAIEIGLNKTNAVLFKTKRLLQK